MFFSEFCLFVLVGFWNLFWNANEMSHFWESALPTFKLENIQLKTKPINFLISQLKSINFLLVAIQSEPFIPPLIMTVPAVAVCDFERHSTTVNGDLHRPN